MEYRRRRELFEDTHGRILNAYWCANSPSGIAITQMPVRWWSRKEGSLAVHVHTAFGDELEALLASALHQGEAFATKAQAVLEGNSLLLTNLRVLSASASVMRVADRLMAFEKRVPEEGAESRQRAVDQQVQDALRNYHVQLNEAEGEYERAAVRAAQARYMWGTITGFPLVLGAVLSFLALISIFATLQVQDRDTKNLIGCTIAGALGSVTSVAWRVTSGDFAVDYEVGIKVLRRLALFRPFIGAIFGAALYFALKSGFVDIGQANKDFYYYAFIAFLGGFSERFAPDIFGTVEANVNSAARRGGSSRGRRRRAP